MVCIQLSISRFLCYYLIFLCKISDYIPNDGEQHRQRCFEWRALETDAERKAHFAQYGIKWTELARLPYFNIVRQSIVDPMHNLLLGMLIVYH